MNKFNIGDRVVVLGGTFSGSKGTVVSFDACDGDTEHGPSYEYQVRLDNTTALFPMMFLQSNLARVVVEINQ